MSAIQSSYNEKNSEFREKMGLCLSVCTMVALTLFVCLSLEEPKGPEFSINGAYLTRFNYIKTNHTLSYKLPLNITLTNPYKDPFELIDTQVTAYYQKERFGLVTLIDSRTTFRLEAKNTTIFQNAVVQGWKPMVFEEPVLPNTAHFYSIDVVIAFKQKIREIDYTMSGEVMCNLNVPLSFNEISCNGYKPTKCFQVFLE
ncbi:hypothetical protein ACE6H2_007617 [Prunus campanulata]